jgi:hypothetical protein
MPLSRLVVTDSTFLTLAGGQQKANACRAATAATNTVNLIRAAMPTINVNCNSSTFS